MAGAHESADAGTGAGTTGAIGTGWRVFQILGLLSALAWLASYTVFTAPNGAFSWVAPLFSGEIPAWGTVVFDISPLVSVLVILLAVWPSTLQFMQGDNWQAYALRALAFIIPAAWMLNVFVGTPMVDKLITQPLAPSRQIPFFAGVFLHVVFQHWFQAIAAIAFSLVPDQFETLTASETPAGIQCAVVDCA
ncbi:hypothetical protein ACH9L7_14070 [Haloferax sp. S1W]|uniref:hypothetical protein n=1 Tax=Haloferax sp. S1W TaxID=3377110 RepID=UPI0037C7D449